MSANWDVWLSDFGGDRICALNAFISLSTVRVENGIGAFSVTYPLDMIDRTLLKPDRLLEFWRTGDDGKPQWINTGFARKISYSLGKIGAADTLTISGPDRNDLLRRRIVAYKAGTAQASKTGCVDDIMKAIVRENLGALAIAARDLSAMRFSVAVDASLGATITKSFAFQNALDVLLDLNAISEIATPPVLFDIVPYQVNPLALGFRFETYLNQIGRDRTATASARFGLAYNNIGNIEAEADYSNEINYVYAGGQGDGADRLVEERYDTARIDLSPWNRCEAFADARLEAIAAGVDAKGDAVLAAGNPAIRFACEIQETKGTQYGRDWDFGDKIPIQVFDQTFAARIKKVLFEVQPDGEKITGRVEL